MHSHSEQYLELTQVPQQSPPSKLQSLMLVSSLQMPFPTLAFVILSVSPVLHMHSEHNSLFTQGPQQSCPSKEQWRLLLKSWQKPSPISFGNWHSIFEEKKIFAYIKLLRLFLKSFLPFVMHPEIVSGIEIATKRPFGAESSLFSNNMVQSLLEQVIE